jgi:hypothetical protein
VVRQCQAKNPAAPRFLHEFLSFEKQLEGVPKEGRPAGRSRERALSERVDGMPLGGREEALPAHPLAGGAKRAGVELHARVRRLQMGGGCVQPNATKAGQTQRTGCRFTRICYGVWQFATPVAKAKAQKRYNQKNGCNALAPGIKN